MPALPAFCDTCGAIFPSGIVAENSTNISLSNCAAGPCPRCGGLGHIPDGVYNFIGNTIQLLSGSNRSINELNRLADLLRTLQEKKATYEETKQVISKELPELSSVADLLPKTRQDFYQFIALILSIITLLVMLATSGENKPKVNVNQVVNYVYQQYNTTIENTNRSSLNESISTQTKIQKIGRNQKCPCGSGKKYKHCHGNNN